MQKDFHFHCVAVLARAAGFEPDDALTIAYASQYTDDSTESELIRLRTREGELRFDPVRTSYRGLGSVLSLGWSAQKRVWIPFHFIPPQPFRPREGASFSFITKANSPFARLILDQAASGSTDSHRRRLCRIGIALHTFADSWAHLGFSGRQNAFENDVEDIHLLVAGKYERPAIVNIILDLAPQIGHGEAGYFPDLPFQAWKYLPGRSATEKEHVERDNASQFLDAAEAIYARLRKMSGSHQPLLAWDDELKPEIRRHLQGRGGPEVEPQLADLLSPPAYEFYQTRDLHQRCERWRQAFASLFEPYPENYIYDQQSWRQQALDGPTDWDGFAQRDWDRAEYGLKRDFWDSLWVHFHRAALRQRHLVLENLP
jgi:hypothetical protein